MIIKQPELVNTVRYTDGALWLKYRDNQGIMKWELLSVPQTDKPSQYDAWILFE